MTALGEFLGGLPMPLGAIVTGLLPPVAIVGILGAVFAIHKGPRVVAVVLAVVGVGALIGAVAFYSYASGQT